MDQVAFRRLENGDLMQVLVDRTNLTATIALGESVEDPACPGALIPCWTWKMQLSGIGLAELQLDLGKAAVVLATHNNATLSQRTDNLRDLLAERASP